MSLLSFVEWLAGTRGSIALHESLYMYPLIESVHVLTLVPVRRSRGAARSSACSASALRSVPVTEVTAGCSRGRTPASW